jgi:hypothetical protein
MAHRLTYLRLLDADAEGAKRAAELSTAIGHGPGWRLALMSFAFDLARHFFQPRGIGRAGD